MMKKYIMLVATVTLLSNCASYKPDSRGVEQRDYNGRIYVSAPHYKVKPSLASYTGMLAFAAAGGYAAYQYGDGIVTYYDKGERKNIKEADAAIGALTSFSIAYLTNKLLFKTNTTKEIDDYKKWMKKAKLTKDYSFLRSYSNTDLMVIDKSYESNYTVRNYADVLDFEKAFPNSIQTDRVLKDAIKVVKRNELGSLIYKYPNSAYIKDMKYHYIDTSPSLMDFYKTSYRYNDVNFPNKKDKIKSFLWTTTKSDLADVISEYPKDQYVAVLKNSYIDKSKDLLAFYNALNKYSDFKYPNKKQKMSSYLPQSSKTMLSSVVGRYPNDEYVSILKTSYVEKSRSVSDLFEAKERYPSVKYNYDERALELLTNLDELSLFEEKVGSSEIVTKGKNKIDDILWNKAEIENSIVAYKSYIEKAPLNLKNSLANERIERLTKEEEERRIERERKNKESLDLYGYPLIINTSSYRTNFIDTGYTVWFDDGVVGAYRLGGRTGKYNISGGWKYKTRYYRSKEDAIYGAYCKGKYKALCSDDRGYYMETNTSSYNDYSSSNNDGNSSNKGSSSSNSNECDKTKINRGLNIPSVVKTGKYGGSWMGNYERAEFVKFSDGTNGNIGYRKGKWYIRDFGVNTYYQSKGASIYALYFYKKCNIITTKGRTRL